MAAMPKGRMGPPLRSFATDAQDCIMVRVSWPTEYKVVVRRTSRRERRAPLDSVIATTNQHASVLEAVKMRRDGALGKA
jgi:hypothetical protein